MSTATVTSPELNELLKHGRGPRMIDVRTPAEFETVHIPGAYNVPLDLLREHREEIAEHVADDIVLVCRSGQRASTAEEALRNAGLTNVRILDGGMTAWQNLGYDTRRGTQRWDLERQVRLVAGSLVLSSILGSLAAPKLKWVAGGIGAGLATAAVTNTCTMGMLLAKLPYNRSQSCDAQTLVAPLLGSPACKAC